MPRPAPTNTEPDAGPSSFTDAWSRVDAPHARYLGAAIELSGRTLRVTGPEFDDEFLFDELPDCDLPGYQYGSGSIVGTVQGLPLAVVRDTRCTCAGSGMVPK